MTPRPTLRVRRVALATWARGKRLTSMQSSKKRTANCAASSKAG